MLKNVFDSFGSKKTATSDNNRLSRLQKTYADERRLRRSKTFIVCSEYHIGYKSEEFLKRRLYGGLKIKPIDDVGLSSVTTSFRRRQLLVEVASE